MILHKRDIKKVITDIGEGLLHGADTAICKEGLVKPTDIQYRNTDIALPLLLLRMPTGEIKIHSYDMRALQETLLQIKKDELPLHLKEVGLVADNKQLVNVGTIVRRKMADREMQQTTRSVVKKVPAQTRKGKQRW